jgi:hypothetical protein
MEQPKLTNGKLMPAIMPSLSLARFSSPHHVLEQA